MPPLLSTVVPLEEDPHGKRIEFFAGPENHLDMVLLQTDKSTSSGGVMDVARSLMARRQEMEKELESIIDALDSEAFSNIGLSKPLVDDQGFPLAGIDLYRVRQLRNRFSVLQNDLSVITSQIEASIHSIHEHARATGSISSGERLDSLPFGRVESVVTGSPADDAGVLVGDKVVKFGPLSCVNQAAVRACYDSIPSTLRSVPQNESIEIRVVRLGREEEVTLSITPRESRIGCLIQPL